MRFAFIIFLLALLSGCVLPGQSSYINDPLTGGVDSRTSALLHIPIPSGLQYYPSHSKSAGGARKEGLETWRGYVDQAACGSKFYTNLKAAGWQLRMRQSAGSRAIYIYEKNDELAAIIFQAQGMLTIVNIWVGARLADNAVIDTSPHADEPWTSLPGETYGPADGPKQGESESWGGEEREL